MWGGMRVYDLKDERGRVFAFEVDKCFRRRRTIAGIIEQLAGAIILKVPQQFFRIREDVFFEFEVGGQVFEVWEPFGDSSRYWIGPKDNVWHSEIDLVRGAFADHR